MFDRQHTRSLSPAVREYFLSDEVFAQYTQLAKEYELSDEDAVANLSSFVYRFVSGIQSAQELQAQIELEFFLTTTKASKLLSAIFSRIVSDVAADVPGLAQELLAWGAQKQAGEQVEAEVFVKFFVASFEDAYEPIEQHRLEGLLSVYLQGKRSRQETIAFLQRPPKLGGMEMTEQEAQVFVEAFDVKRSSVQLQDESPTLAVEEPSVITSPSNVPVQLSKTTELDAFSKKDEQEIAQVAASHASVIAELLQKRPEELIDRICLHPDFAFTEDVLQKRCRDIVGARMRNLRDAFQTRALLERPIEEGGLGITGRRLADMMEHLEQTVEVMELRHRQKIATARTSILQTQQERRAQKTALQAQEEKLLSKRYVQTTGKIPNESVAPAAPSLSRASVALSSSRQLQQQQAKLDAQKIRSVVEKSAHTPTVKPLPFRPRVEDVKRMPRLSGPIDELRSFGLIEFRRLSANPQQASDRLKDLINLLDDQGFEKRMEAIRAFQSSPLMRVYGQINKQALLSGTAIDEILSSHPDGLSKAEYQSLMALNADLRF